MVPSGPIPASIPPMAVHRFLGAAWASVHGPSDPRAFLTWMLESGLVGLVPGPAPRALPWRDILAAAADLPVRWVAWRHHSVLQSDRVPPTGPAATIPGERDAFLGGLAATVEFARRAGCPQVILEPGAVAVRGEAGPRDLFDPAVAWTRDLASSQRARRNVGLDRALDQACRTMFEVLRRFDDVRFCLTPSRDVLSLGDVQGFEAILDDLKHPRLTYWHDTSVVARRCQLLPEEEGEWLQAFANRMSGLTLGDSGDGLPYAPPGTGTVDHKLLASYVRRSSASTATVLELDPGVDQAELGGAMAFLDKFGL